MGSGQGNIFGSTNFGRGDKLWYFIIFGRNMREIIVMGVGVDKLCH